jgi:hypothetical protein
MKRIEDIDVLAPVNLPPDPYPHELRFAPPVGTCDTHFHIFGPPHLFPFVGDRARYDDVVTVAHALVARSPSRLIWGTDWPHTDVFVPGSVPNDGDLMNMLIDFVPDVTTRNHILVDNPARLFGFAS